MNDSLILPSHPALRYGGRWDPSDPKCCQTGRGAVYVKARFTGTYLALLLWGSDPDVWWCSQIDEGEVKRWQNTLPEGADLVLAQDNLAPGPHTLTLSRDTEGLGGISYFGGLILAPGEKLLPPEPPLRRRIELIGDSILAGGFALGTTGSTYLENESSQLAFGPQLAKFLQAEYSVIATSGEGVVHNADETQRASEISYAAGDYKRTLYSSGQPLWSFTAFKPQVILVNHGANDFEGGILPAPAFFERGYRQLLELIRHKNPLSLLICLDPLPEEPALQAGPAIQRAVQKLNGQGDKNIHYLPLAERQTFLSPEDYADGEHLLASGHAKVARYLAPMIARLAKW